MSNVPDQNTIDAWVLLHRVQRKLREDVETALKASSLPPLDWYDVLLELHRAGEVGLRQFEIGEKVLLNKHNLSRLIDRLEKNRLAQRYASSEDGRGNQIRITAQGEQTLRQMWPVYGQSIQGRFGDRLEEKECLDLAALLAKLLDSQC
jgi:DNA-binding MarR family transcriptional regulator